MLECYLIPTAGQLLWGLQLLFPILTDTCSMQRGGDLSQDLRSGHTGVPEPHQKELYLHVLNFETSPPLWSDLLGKDDGARTLTSQ